VSAAIAGGPGASMRGMVRVHGELWQAISVEAIATGTRVRVLRVDGLTLDVAPLEPPSRVGTLDHGRERQ
jgi:membrane-bound ClpP family serine protease